LQYSHFFAYGNSPEKDRKHLAVTPFYWDIKNDESRLQTLFPIVWKATKIGYDTTYRTTVFPIVWHKKKIAYGDTTIKNVVFPIYWHKKTPEKDNKVIFPFVWKYDNPERKSLVVFPLYSKGGKKDTSSSFYGVTPFFWHVEKPNFRTNFFVPFFWKSYKANWSNSDTTEFTTIFPVYWKKKNNERNSKVLFPLVWSFDGPNYKSTTVVPFFSKTTSTDSTKKVVGITPFYWKKHKPGLDKTTLFPLYWHKREIGYNDTTETHTLFPFFWTGKTQTSGHEYSYKVAFPFYWERTNPTLKKRTFFPLFWHKTEYSEMDTTVSNVLFPLVWSKKGKYFKSSTVFPLYSYGKSNDNSQKYLVVTPLFYHFRKDGKTTNTLFPIFWNKKEISQVDTTFSSIVFPVYWKKKKIQNGIEDKNSLLFPVYWSHKSATRNDKIVFPVVWSFKSQDYKSLTVFPLFSHGKSSDNSSKYLGITPLFWKLKNKERSRTAFFPLFGHYADTSNIKRFHIMYVLLRHKQQNEHKHTSFLYPLGAVEKKKDYSYFRFAPFFWYQKSPEFSYFSIQPIFYGSTTPEWKKRYYLWMLYSKKEEIGIKKQRNFLWKFAEWSRYNNGDFEYRFIHLLLANVKKDGIREVSIFPLYHKKTEPNGNINISALMHFYSRFKRQLPDSQEFYKEEKIFWFIRLRSNYSQLKAEGKVK